MQYLNDAGLELDSDTVNTWLQRLEQVTTDGDVPLEYPVPTDGCNITDTEEFDTYDISPHVNDRRVLEELYAIIDTVNSEVEADWIGIYKAVDAALVKVAYRGRPSRAEFPITADFAEQSNNVTVARSGQARVIHDVETYRDEGPYYECDSDVRSEACLPIFNDGVIGILDAESFDTGHFTEPRLAGLAAACIAASRLLPEL